MRRYYKRRASAGRRSRSCRASPPRPPVRRRQSPGRALGKEDGGGDLRRRGAAGGEQWSDRLPVESAEDLQRAQLALLLENIVLDEAFPPDVFSQLAFNMFATFYEFEKGMIRQRVTTALAARKAKGLPMGRPPKSKLDPKEDEIRGLLELGVKQKVIAQKMECTETTLCNWLKKRRKEWAANAKAQEK